MTQGFRSIAEQDKLYQIGRRGKKGEKKVTNAKGGESKHNFGNAVDFAFIINGEISWNEKLYQNIGHWAKICGLKLGRELEIIQRFSACRALKSVRIHKKIKSPDSTIV